MSEVKSSTLVVAIECDGATITISEVELVDGERRIGLRVARGEQSLTLHLAPSLANTVGKALLEKQLRAPPRFVGDTRGE